MKNRWIVEQEKDFRDFTFTLYGFRAFFDGIVKKDDAILEIGCGNGYFLERLYKLGYTKLYGVDIVQTAVDECMKRLFPNAYIQKADGHSLPFPDKIFDAVVLSHVLEHSPLPHILLKEVRRIMSDGATVFIEIPIESEIQGGHFVCWESKEEFDLFLRQNGWNIVRSHLGYTELDGEPVEDKENHYWVICN